MQPPWQWWASLQLHDSTCGTGFEPVGRGFESLRARHLNPFFSVDCSEFPVLGFGHIFWVVSNCVFKAMRKMNRAICCLTPCRILSLPRRFLWRGLSVCSVGSHADVVFLRSAGDLLHLFSGAEDFLKLATSWSGLSVCHAGTPPGACLAPRTMFPRERGDSQCPLAAAPLLCGAGWQPADRLRGALWAGSSRAPGRPPFDDRKPDRTTEAVLSSTSRLLTGFLQHLHSS